MNVSLDCHWQLLLQEGVLLVLLPLVQWPAAAALMNGHFLHCFCCIKLFVFLATAAVAAAAPSAQSEPLWLLPIDHYFCHCTFFGLFSALNCSGTSPPTVAASWQQIWAVLVVCALCMLTLTLTDCDFHCSVLFCSVPSDQHLLLLQQLNDCIVFVRPVHPAED